MELTVAKFHKMIKGEYEKCPFCDKKLSQRCIDMLHDVLKQKYDNCPICEKCLFFGCIDRIHCAMRCRIANPFYDIRLGVKKVDEFHDLIKCEYDKCPFCYNKLDVL